MLTPQLNKQQENKQLSQKSCWPRNCQLPPRYTIQETKQAQQEKGGQTKEGWWAFPDQRVYIPEQLADQVVLQQHELTHLGKITLETLLSFYYVHAQLPLCLGLSTLPPLCSK